MAITFPNAIFQNFYAPQRETLNKVSSFSFGVLVPQKIIWSATPNFAENCGAQDQ